jgi:hypothetical protein
MESTREPTQIESDRWEAYQHRFIGRTSPLVKSLVLLAQLAESAQNEIKSITGKIINIIDADQAAAINEIGRRAQILDNQITGVLLQKYAIQLDNDGKLNIVAPSAPEGDIYPRTDMSLGIAPIIIAAGIMAITLLIGADEANDALEKKARIEAIKLQQKMLDADREMMSLPDNQRKQWEQWKTHAAETAKNAVANIPGSSGWIEKFLGKKGSSILVAGLVAVAAAYFLIPTLRRN